MTQYNDMLKDVGSHGQCNTIFMPSGSSSSVGGQMLAANLAGMHGMRR